jgi:hypothetical protein
VIVDLLISNAFQFKPMPDLFRHFLFSKFFRPVLNDTCSSLRACLLVAASAKAGGSEESLEWIFDLRCKISE